jgi:hypothetical protein
MNEFGESSDSGRDPHIVNDELASVMRKAAGIQEDESAEEVRLLEKRSRRLHNLAVILIAVSAGVYLCPPEVIVEIFSRGAIEVTLTDVESALRRLYYLTSSSAAITLAASLHYYFKKRELEKLPDILYQEALRLSGDEPDSSDK